MYDMPMRTSMNIPRELIQEAKKAAGVKTQTLAVILGLQGIIKKKRLSEAVDMYGTGAVQLTQNELRGNRRRR